MPNTTFIQKQAHKILSKIPDTLWSEYFEGRFDESQLHINEKKFTDINLDDLPTDKYQAFILLTLNYPENESKISGIFASNTLGLSYIEIFKISAALGYTDTAILYLSNQYKVFLYAEQHYQQYSQYLDPLINSLMNERLITLHHEKDTLFNENPNAVFDVKNNLYCLYIIHILIKRNDRASNDEIQFLLDIPSVIKEAHDVNSANSDFIKLLTLALSTGNSDASAILLEALSKKKGLEKQPIHLAAKFGDLELAKALIEYRPDLVEQGGPFGDTPLAIAAMENNLNMVKFLISKGACPDAQAIDQQKTLLYKPYNNGYHDVVAVIMDASLQRVQNRFDKKKSMYESLGHFKNRVKFLPPQLAIELYTKVKFLEEGLFGNNTAEEKEEIIATFLTESIALIKGPSYGIKNVILSLALSAIVFVLTIMIGFGIGFALGAWSGPGAVLTGLVAANASAVALVGVSSSLGVLSFAYNLNRLFTPTPIETNIQEMAIAANQIPQI